MLMNILFKIITICLFAGACNSQLISPIFGEDAFKNNILYNIINAKKSIKATIYKFNDKDISNAFKNVAKNGVKFDFICDKEAIDECGEFNNFGSVHEFSMVNYTKLHAKSMLIDDEMLILGSFNFDQSGFSTNMEIGIITKDSFAIENYNYFIQKLKTNI